MYRRFSMLLRSPLRLGVPSLHFSSDEPTTILDASTAGSRPVGRPGGPAPRGPRRRALAGVAAALVAALVITGFAAVFALRLRSRRSCQNSHGPTKCNTPADPDSTAYRHHRTTAQRLRLRQSAGVGQA